MSLHKIFQSKVNRLLTILGAISIAAGGAAFGVDSLFSKPAQETGATNVCSFGHIFLDMSSTKGWGSNTTDSCTYIAYVSGGTATGQNVTLGTCAGGTVRLQAELPTSARGYNDVWLKRCNPNNTGNIYNQYHIPATTITSNGCYNLFSSITYDENTGYQKDSLALISEYKVLNGNVASSPFLTENSYSGGSNDPYFEPADPTAESGYTWDGNWYTDSACTTVFSVSGYDSTYDLSLYAKYTQSSFDVTEYKVVNGTLNSTSIRTEPASSSSAFTPSSYSETGYTTVGWYTDSSCSTPYTATTWSAAGNLYVKLSQNYPVSEYRVVDGNLNSTVFATETAVYENLFTPTTPAAVSGFTYDGWFTDSACTTTYTRTVITANTPLYLKVTSTSASTYILALDVFSADFPSGYNTDNWSTANTVYVYLWNSSFNSGLVLSGGRSADTGNFSWTVSTGWSSALFVLDSTSFNSPSSTNAWRKTADITLPATKPSPLYYRLVGTTSAASNATTVQVTVSTAARPRTIYARNVEETSTPVCILKAWASSAPNVGVYIKSSPFTDVASGLNVTTWKFTVPSTFDTFAIANRRYGTTIWFVTSVYTYAFNTVDANNPAVLSISAKPTSSLARPTCNWVSCRQVTNSDSSYTSIPLPSSSFFRFWIARPSTSWGSTASYEDGYFWTLIAKNGTVDTEVMPKGYVIDSAWSNRILSFYDVPVAYAGVSYRWICRSSSATSGATVVSMTSYSDINLGVAQASEASICYLSYSASGLSSSLGSCSATSIVLAKTVLQGYLTCNNTTYNGYGSFVNVLKVWFTSSTDYDKVTGGSSGMQAALMPFDYDYNNGSYSYNGAPTLTTVTLYAKTEKMRQLATGSSGMYGPLKTETNSAFSSTLIIVGCSGGAGFLFVAILYLISRRKKKVRI